MAAAVAEKSGGSLKIEVYPAGQLGGTRQLEENVRLGLVDLAQASAPTMSANYPLAELFTMPGLYTSGQHVRAAVEGSAGQAIYEGVRTDLGVRILQTIYQPASQMTANREVKTLADFNGFKMRVPEVPIWLAFWSYLGTTPTPMDFGELYTSLQLGTVDGQENPMVNINSGRFYEVQKYLIKTGHVRTLNWILINEQKYQSLSEEHRKIIDEESTAAEAWINDTWASQDKDAEQNLLKNGMIAIEPAAEIATKISEFGPEYVKTKDEKTQALYADIVKLGN